MEKINLHIENLGDHAKQAIQNGLCYNGIFYKNKDELINYHGDFMT